MSKSIPIRRPDRERHQVGAFESGPKRYYDNVSEHTVIKLFTGDCYVTAEKREMLITILGSCIAVCARDPVAAVGGMNHILLPGDGGVDVHSGAESSTRYGAFAMEELVNGILKLGGCKGRLEIKIFGGGRVMNSGSDIGGRNILFVREYLENEKLKILAEDVGGEWPRRVHYFPDTGKVRVRRLHRKSDLHIVEEEKAFETKEKEWEAKAASNIELFG